MIGIILAYFLFSLAFNVYPGTWSYYTEAKFGWSSSMIGLSLMTSGLCMAFVQFVNRLRINLACQLLMSDETLNITDVCYSAGFNNVSNFNRQFLAQKGMSPSRFRALLAENIDAARAA